MLKRHGRVEEIVAAGLRSYGAAMSELGNYAKREVSRCTNNRAENSHLPFRRRERAMLCFRRTKTLQKFASVHANVHNQLASPPFGSARNVIPLIARPTKNGARTHWLIGRTLWAEASPSKLKLRQSETSYD